MTKPDTGSDSAQNTLSPAFSSDSAPLIADSAAPKRPRRRIAQKLLLLYFLPVSILVIAGVVLPLLLWNFFGATIREFDTTVSFTGQADALLKAATDTEAQYRDFILSREANRTAGQKRVRDARQEYQQITTQIEDYLDSHNDDNLRQKWIFATGAYKEWNRTYVDPELFSTTRRKGTSPEFQANLARVAFISVQRNLTSFVKAAHAVRDSQEPQARTTSLLRQLSVVLIPLAAFLLSALIGRSIAISITRPLEELTRATEELERGGSVALLAAETSRTVLSDDEIGELQQSFIRMARNIGHREAMLRAQNDTLGALNQRIESVLNATNDAILMLDRAGAFSIVNQRFAELFGIEVDVLLDQTFAQAAPLLLSRFRKRQEVRDRMEKLLADPQDVAEENFEVVEPVPRILRLFSAPVRGESLHDSDREIIGRILVFRDVTRETMVDRMKTEFVSTVSHELRTPLTAIKGYVDLMVSGQTGPMNNVQTEFLTMVQSSTKRLTALINDLLDISRIESGRIEIRQESVDYLPLVREAIRMMSGEAEGKGLSLQMEVKGDPNAVPPVYGDADRITQVLVNFLSNSIKYTPSGGKITVIVEYSSNVATTCVADTGIGIAREDQGRLFQKFFRADNSTTRETGGTGLGLAITRAILDKLGGSVWVESDVGQGSRFWFTLPTVDVEMEANTNETHHLILNIDSDTTLLHRMGHELRLQGYVTSNAATPAEAQRRARGLRPDLITLDLLTPGLNGIEVLQILRQNPVTAKIPVVLMTVQNIAGRLEATDGIHYMPDAVDDSELTQAIKENISFSRNRRETILVVGDIRLIDRVRAIIAARGENIRLMAATTNEEADDRIAESFPDLTILSTGMPGVLCGQVVSRLRERRPGEKIPLVALVDATLLASNVSFLPEPGAGAVPLSRIGLNFRRLLGGNAPARPEEKQDLLTEQAMRSEVLAA